MLLDGVRKSMCSLNRSRAQITGSAAQWTEHTRIGANWDIVSAFSAGPSQFANGWIDQIIIHASPDVYDIFPGNGTTWGLQSHATQADWMGNAASPVSWDDRWSASGYTDHMEQCFTETSTGVTVAIGGRDSIL